MLTPPERSGLWAFVVTGTTVFGEPAAVAGAWPGADRATVEAAVRQALAAGALVPLPPGHYPDMGQRVTVFEVPPRAVVETLAGWRAAGWPAARPAGGG